MAYYSRDQLEQMGFKRLGVDVKISIKASIYDCDQIEVGDNSRVDDNCVVSGKVSLGRNVHITPMCLLAGGEKGIIFEDFSAIAYGVKVFTQSDDYSGMYMTNPTVPDQYTNPVKRAVYIGRHVIVGVNSVVLPGSQLREGASVGAMSLVQGILKPWSIYSGVPAKFLRERSRKLLGFAEEYLNEHA